MKPANILVTANGGLTAVENLFLGQETARLGFIAKRILSRTLADKELAVVTRIKASILDHYKAKPEDAKALIAVGESKADATLDPAELAAWTMICNQLLNLDEAL